MPLAFLLYEGSKIRIRQHIDDLFKSFNTNSREYIKQQAEEAKKSYSYIPF